MTAVIVVFENDQIVRMQFSGTKYIKLLSKIQARKHPDIKQNNATQLPNSPYTHLKSTRLRFL